MHFNDPDIQDHTPGRRNNNLSELFPYTKSNFLEHYLFQKQILLQSHAPNC